MHIPMDDNWVVLKGDDKEIIIDELRKSNNLINSEDVEIMKVTLPSGKCIYYLVPTPSPQPITIKFGGNENE